MSVRLPINERDGVFFITFTCKGWLPLFECTNSYDVVYKWFDYLKGKGHFICAYVIMPNHLHVLLAFRSSDKSIHTVVSNAKRFMAYELVSRLEKQGRPDVLDQLVKAVNPSDRKRGKLHQVFEPSFDCKECYSEAFTEEKIHYLHQNPCKGKWQLASSPLYYPHCSALYYHTGEQGVYPITHYKELRDVDLTQPPG